MTSAINSSVPSTDECPLVSPISEWCGSTLIWKTNLGDNGLMPPTYSVGGVDCQIPVSEQISSSDPDYRNPNVELVVGQRVYGLLTGTLDMYRPAVVIRKYSPQQIAENPLRGMQESALMRGCFYASAVWGKYMNAEHAPPPNRPLEALNYSAYGLQKINNTWVNPNRPMALKMAEERFQEKGSCSVQ